MNRWTIYPAFSIGRATVPMRVDPHPPLNSEPFDVVDASVADALAEALQDLRHEVVMSVIAPALGSSGRVLHARVQRADAALAAFESRGENTP